MKKVSKAVQIFEAILKSSYQEIYKIVQPSEIDNRFLVKCEKLLDNYASPKNYINWNEYTKICLMTGSAKSIEASLRDSDVRGVVACMAFRSAVVANACARYVSQHIIESFAETPIPELPPEVIDVLPFVHLMLPRGTVYDAEGDEVISIMIQSGMLYENEPSEQNKNFVKTFFPNEKLAPKELMGASGLQIVTITKGGMDVFQEFITPDAKSWHESNVKYTDQSKYKSANTEKIIRIAVNSLLVHLYEPELITTDPKPVTKGIGFSSKKKAPLSPTWIGKTFRSFSEYHRPDGDNLTKLSVRPHWRRGHWHSVCCGPKRSERRIQWFKPIYINSSAKLF